MTDPDRRHDPTATPPAGHVEETPEAAPLAPPAWRDQFADPILQRGQHY
ncbi:MAG: hypothetical protein H0U10_12630, partial [Chloroflexia bacterium]|nr:hypothetical protein [Chloroflexia bacterium]